MGTAFRLALPLGLLRKQSSLDAGAPPPFRPSGGTSIEPLPTVKMLIAPSVLSGSGDRIDEIERINATWTLIAFDGLSCTASGLPTAIDDRDVSIFLPTVPSSVPPAASATQDFLCPDLFTFHPAPHATSFCLETKAYLLLRKVSFFVRLNETRGGGDPRATPDFNALDTLCSDFLCGLSITGSLFAVCR